FASGKPYGLYWEDADDDYGTTIIEDCEFAGFRLRALHMDDTNWTDTLIVNNCLFREIGETGIYGSHADRNIDVVKITNSSFYMIGQNGIYLRNVGDLEVSHCTFFYNDSTISNRHGMAIRARDDTTVTIMDNIIAKHERGMDVYGSAPVVEYNLFWEVLGDWIDPADATQTFPIFNFEDDPLFKDTSSVNLDLALDAENSSAIGAASDGVSNLGDPSWGTYVVSGVADGDLLPMVYALHQNYPNPFNPSTTIKFDVVEMGHVSLVVYDLLGREIVNLVDQTLEPGFHTIAWNANRLASGIYFYRITVNDFVKSRKLVVLK
ncbi:T9SS type A sorting domain-containing protein, partial [Candidatus Neomarinimicrobiota bacterium]